MRYVLARDTYEIGRLESYFYTKLFHLAHLIMILNNLTAKN